MDNVINAQSTLSHLPMDILALNHHAHKLLTRMVHAVIVKTTITSIQITLFVNQEYAIIDKQLLDKEHALIAQPISILLITRETAKLVHVIKMRFAIQMDHARNAQNSKLFYQPEQKLVRNV